MRAVSIKVLKNKFRKYIRIAASGERVLVTDQGRVIAELGPPREWTAESAYSAILAMVARNPLRPTETRVVMKWEEVLRELDVSRAERL
jgi:prevent-host-death family protein